MPAEVRGRIACPAPARTGDGAPPADHLVDPHPLARPDRRFGAPSLESALRLAVLASARPRQRKSRKAVTGDVLAKLLEACASDRLVDVRHRALFLTAFASGGRPRSEVAGLRVDDLVDDDPVLGDPAGSWPKIRLSDRGGKPRREAMQQSLHKSVTQAATYYNNAERKQGRATRLLI